jgi:hypothetical protein
MAMTLNGDTGITFPDATTQSKAVSQATPFAVTALATTGAQISLPEGTNNGANFIALKAADTLAANTTFTLPAADGTTGQYLQTNGAGILAFATIASGIPSVTRTSNTQLVAADSGNLVNITSGTFSQTFAAAASLGTSWFIYLQNSGTGDITLTPNGAETIDGLTSFIMYPGEIRLVRSNGTALFSIVLQSFYRVFTASATFIKPPGYVGFSGFLWGGGGSGASVSSARGGGGGGGACNPFNVVTGFLSSSCAVTIGDGGTAVTNTFGNSGGNSSLDGKIFAYGGAGGCTDAGSASGGSGGGILSAGNGSTSSGSFQNGGRPSITASSGIVDNSGFGGGGSGSGGVVGGFSYSGGGGGGGSTAVGGSSYYGGGGGGGGTLGGVAAGGTSVIGGAGGGGTFSTVANAGSAPGGGGGGQVGSAVASGAGARGELRIWGIM